MFYLAGNAGWTRAPDMRTLAVTTKGCLQVGRALWLGVTSWVAAHGQLLCLEASQDFVDIDGLRVERDTKCREIERIGPLMVYPLMWEHKIAGVVRLVRTRTDERPFTPGDAEKLKSIFDLITISLIDAREKVSLVHEISRVASGSSVKVLIEAMGNQVIQLLRSDPERSAIFLSSSEEDPQIRGRRYEVLQFRGPQSARRILGTQAYKKNDQRLTAHVWKGGCADCDKRDYLFSNDLHKDLEADGSLYHARPHSHGSDTQSFLAVPIFLTRTNEAEPHARGVIRVSSPSKNAFSFHDLETLQALASQIGHLLLIHGERERRQEVQRRVVATSDRPIIEISRSGRVMSVNSAGCRLLGCKPAELPRGAAELLFGGEETHLSQSGLSDHT